MQKEFETLGSFLTTVAACQKPDQKVLEALLAPFPTAIEAVSRAKEANRRERDWLSHLTLLGEGAPVIGWVVNVSRASKGSGMMLNLHPAAEAHDICV